MITIVINIIVFNFFKQVNDTNIYETLILFLLGF